MDSNTAGNMGFKESKTITGYKAVDDRLNKAIQLAKDRGIEYQNLMEFGLGHKSALFKFIEEGSGIPDMQRRLPQYKLLEIRYKVHEHLRWCLLNHSNGGWLENFFHEPAFVKMLLDRIEKEWKPSHFFPELIDDDYTKAVEELIVVKFIEEKYSPVQIATLLAKDQEVEWGVRVMGNSLKLPDSLSLTLYLYWLLDEKNSKRLDELFKKDSRIFTKEQLQDRLATLIGPVQ
ncbi:hypothetical protein B0J11DRAFT_582778 [Dendryphion nanum]|uniref:Uncharacterized protein n=1 Tax=Dendryphion nanum TaxID=256645 RepID=A0A9P9IGP3_9PLEO|nr:hypothetical protein B0J11DRAFT_582778 [Dendryphion nanum]